MLSHRGQLWSAYVSAIDMGVRPTDRVAVAMPLYHIGAKNICLTRSVHGCTVVLHRAFRVEPFFKSLQDYRVTETLLAPTMLNDLLDAYPDARRGAAVAGEGLLLGSADARGDPAARHEGARAHLRPGLRHDEVGWTGLHSPPAPAHP